MAEESEPSPPDSADRSSGSTTFEEAAASALTTTEPSPAPGPTPPAEDELATEPAAKEVQEHGQTRPEATGEEPSSPQVRNLDEHPHTPAVKLAELAPVGQGDKGPRQQRHSSSPDPGAMLIETLKHSLAELDSQVTLLNSKLVKSYERVAGLEDQLHVSQEDLDRTRERNKTLDLEAAQHAEALRGGILIESADVQGELQRLTQRLLNETAARSESETSLSSLRSELDDLSASLFAEANKMVATEKLSRIKAERKQQVAEEAMKGVQDAMVGMRGQLSGLGSQLEQAENDRDGWRQRFFDAGGLEDAPAQTSGLEPGIVFSDGHSVTKPNEPARSLSSARAVSMRLGPIPPRLMNDILPYAEFIGFIRHLRKTRSEALARPAAPGDGYTSTGTSMYGSSLDIGRPVPSHPSRSSSTLPPPDPKELLASVLPLSSHLSQPFLKRCVEEDSDPTLRLDLAPALNFISRRGVVTAIVEGSLVIEPVWGNATQYESCSLCGTGLERWTGGPSTPTGTTAQAMRKMLGTTTWSFGNLKSKKSSSMLTDASSPTTPPISSANRTVSFGPPSSIPSSPSDRERDHHHHHHPVSLHTFRTNDNASTRYPLCPTYCLARLRSVCDFWTYVRSVEKGLLLEEGFRFATASPAPTMATGGGGGHQRQVPSIDRQRSLGLGIGSSSSVALDRQPAGASPPPPPPPPKAPAVEVQPAAEEKEEVADGKGDGSEAKEDVDKEEEETADIKDSPEHVSGREFTSSPEPGKDADLHPDPASSDDPSPSPTAPATTTTTNESSPAALPPPLPKRSAARPTSPNPSGPPPLPARSTSPKAREQPMPGIRISTGSGSSSTSAMTLPPPPPRRNPTTFAPPPVRSATTVSSSSAKAKANGTVGPSGAGAADALGLGQGWEDRCWAEVVRLKEEMFWRRVGSVQAPKES